MLSFLKKIITNRYVSNGIIILTETSVLLNQDDPVWNLIAVFVMGFYIGYCVGIWVSRRNENDQGF